MKKKSLVLLLLIAFASILALSISPKGSIAGRTLTVAVDLAHGESDKYLSFIIGNITFVNWKIIAPGANITSDLLSDVDILLIGQPTRSFTADEIVAIVQWFNSGKKAVWIAADSDYGAMGPVSQEIANTLLEAVGTKLRIDLGSLYDNVNCAAAYYRVLLRVMPDNIFELYTSVISEGITKPVLGHGPGLLVWVDEGGTYHDPAKETFPGLVRIVWSYETAYFAENNPPYSRVYDTLFDKNRTFVFLAAEYMRDLNNIVVASGESPYGDYEPTWSSRYYGVDLDGPRFVTNMIRWFVKLLTEGPLTPVFSLTDPEGDDKGPGTYRYPTAAVFVPGVFDLTKFEVYETATSVIFKVYVKDLGGNPWNGPNGFCLQFPHIFVKTESGGELNKTAFGLNVEIVPGWHFALLVAPGWGTDPVPDGERAALYYANGTRVVQNGGFSVATSLNESAIVVTVSKALLPGVRVSAWRYAVLLASYDGYGSMKVRGVLPGDPTEWNLGGADPYAIIAGVEPRAIDVLVPTAQEQYNMLTSYNVDTRALAKVSVYPPELIVTPITITVTATLPPVTVTTTTVETVTHTTVEVTSITVPTISEVTKTEARTVTQTTKLVETVTPMELTYGLIGVVIVLLAATAFLFIRRPK
ncbi:MAG: glucodextranase DOMON-like domain-containing protein [Desulfurococcaceae archaeon]|nr:hypothetical protein [Sulfolobales archaeon]MDW8170189.1 glucodextranase DOMON-like domain-containing protein [Desulfurococcaceae archaeon]